MTLNTFHLAGHGAGVNVTLGIPRLREILMTANNNIKTPTMTLPLSSINQQKAIARNLAEKFKRVTLKDVAERLEVETQLAKNGSLKVWEYRVALYFQKERGDLERMLRERFIVVLLKLIEKEKKLLGIAKTVQMIATQKGEEEIPAAPKEEDEDEKKEGEEEGVEGEEEEGEEGEEEEVDSKVREIMQPDNLEEIIKFQPEKKDTNELEGTEFKDSVFKFTVRVGVRGRKKILIRKVVERALSEVAVQQLRGIKDCFIVEQKNEKGKKELALQTDGVNFGILWHLAEQIQLDRVSSTDLDATLRFYGVSGLVTVD